MPYYKCKCGAKYVGWGCSGICQKCGDKMRRISREEFYGDEEKGLEYFEEEGREEIK